MFLGHESSSFAGSTFRRSNMFLSECCIDYSSQDWSLDCIDASNVKVAFFGNFKEFIKNAIFTIAGDYTDTETIKK